MPIKYKIIMYFFYFVLIMLLLLWTFQVLFLDSFYKAIKTKQIQACANSIVSNLQNKNIEDLIERIHSYNDINVMLLDTTTNDYVKIYVTEDKAMGGHLALNDTSSQLVRYYNAAIQNGGTTIEITQGVSKGKSDDLSQLSGDAPPFEKENIQYLVYAGVFDVKLGEDAFAETDGETAECMLILTSLISPVGSTVDTLRIQLIIVTCILLLIAVVLSIIVARQISRPIVEINQTAKQLAKQNYDVRFSGSGYKEIEELNDTLNFTCQELSKIDRLKTELIANISHDLRTPLTMITGYGEVMRDLPGENTPENIQIIIDEATRLSALVTDLLDISKLQSGAVTLEKSVFSITDSIQSIFKRYSKLKEQDGYTINFEYDKNVLVNADEIKIGQVIYNLVNNAINYAGEDKTVIVRQIVKGDTVRIEVEDHGKGIAQENLEHIWDRYYKVDKSHKSAVIGTGLGLSIVKNMLNLHNAHFGVISNVDKGSVFWFELKTVDEKK